MSFKAQPDILKINNDKIWISQFYQMKNIIGNTVSAFTVGELLLTCQDVNCSS